MADFSGALSALAVVVAIAAAGAAVRGARRLARGLRHADEDWSSLEVVRGIRGIVVGVGAGALAAGFLSGQTWLLVFGAVFLAEEIYETGVLVGILRRQARA
jgi:hypothetical protein